MERLTTFPSDDDYSSGHDYRSNCNQIDEHFHSLALGSVPHFRGVGDRSYHIFGSSDNSSNAFSGYDFDQYSTPGVTPRSYEVHSTCNYKGTYVHQVPL